MITLPVADLTRALRRVAPVADARSSVPILSCVLFRADRPTLTLAASDSIRSVRTSVACTGSGSFAVDAKTIDRIAASLPSGDVSLELQERAITVRAGRSRFRVPVLDGADFPPLFDAGLEKLASIPADVLLDALVAVRHAVSDDSTRPHLAGVKLEGDGEWLRAIATDGHRLAKVDRKLANTRSFDAFVTATAIGPIIALAAEKDAGDVVLSVEGSFLRAQRDTTIIACRLSSETFPSWRKIIPKLGKSPWTLSRVDALAALRRVAIVAGSTNGVRLAGAGDAVTMRAESAGHGEGVEELPCRGAAGAFAVNGSYLADALEHADGDEVTVSSTGELDPVLVMDDHGFTSIIMPMRA